MDQSSASQGMREVFRFMRFGFDVTACDEAMQAGAVKFTERTWDRDFIAAYAERLLGLRPNQQGGIGGVFMHVNVAYARGLGPTHDSAPVTLVEAKGGVLHVGERAFFLVDGNHRMAKAYFDGAEVIRVREVGHKDARSFLL